jgi:multimeric flavodoxin WrbA
VRRRYNESGSTWAKAAASVVCDHTKHLLIVFHSGVAKVAAMAEAVHQGATDDEVDGVDTRLRDAFDADEQDLLWADGIILGTPENFGYMSGALKDFFDRTYYPVEGRTEGRPFAVFIGAGNDGTGALNAIRRIARGYAWREVQEPVICVGEIDRESLTRCTELGTAMAAGLELGLF